MLTLDTTQAFEFYRSFLGWYAFWHKPKLYLELGIHDGETLFRIAQHCEQAIGVDVAPKINKQFIPSNTAVFEMSSDQYFLSHRVNPNLVFIDADHSAEQVYKDTLNSLGILAPDGLIVLHDTFPDTEQLTAPGLCGMAYKAVPMLQELNRLQVFTFPVTFGVTLVSKRPVPSWL